MFWCLKVSPALKLTVLLWALSGIFRRLSHANTLDINWLIQEGSLCLDSRKLTCTDVKSLVPGAAAASLGALLSRQWAWQQCTIIYLSLTDIAIHRRSGWLKALRSAEWTVGDSPSGLSTALLRSRTVPPSQQLGTKMPLWLWGQYGGSIEISAQQRRRKEKPCGHMKFSFQKWNK